MVITMLHINNWLKPFQPLIAPRENKKKKYQGYVGKFVGTTFVHVQRDYEQRTLEHIGLYYNVKTDITEKLSAR